MRPGLCAGVWSSLADGPGRAQHAARVLTRADIAAKV